MDIKLIVVGKIKEKYLDDAVSEYIKRIKPFCNLNIIEIKELNYMESKRNLSEEGKNILKNISNNDFVITLEIEGKMLSSVELANYIGNHYTYNNKTLTFIIGSSDGICDEVKQRSERKVINPVTKQVNIVPKKKIPVFKTGKIFKSSIR